MINLEELDVSSGKGARYICGINQEGIQNLTSLRKLRASNNYYITDVNHMTNLEELDASYKCGINQDGIQHLASLRKIDASCNENINLEELKTADDRLMDWEQINKIRYPATQ